MTPERRFAVSRDADLRLRYAADQLLAAPNLESAWIVTPTKAAGDDFVRMYPIGNATGRGGLRRSTPLQLALEVAALRLAAAGKAPVSGLGLEALAARAAYESAAGEELAVLGPVARTVGFGRALGRTIAELRSESVPPESLPELGHSAPDLSRLLSRYERGLEESALADRAEIFRTATASLEAGETSGPGGLPLVLIDVWGRNQTEFQFLRALIERSSRVVVVAPAHLGDHLKPLADAIGLKPHVIPETQNTNSLNQMRYQAFETEAPESRKSDSSLEFFSATDEARESVEIARRIQIAASEGGRFDQIAILLRSPEAYQTLIEDALGRAGLPAYYSRGSVRPNPTGRAFLSLIACAAEGLSASRFSEYLSLGQVPAAPEGGGPQPWSAPQGELFADTSVPALPDPETAAGPESESGDDDGVTEGTLRTPFGWERLLVDAAVIGGRDRWARRLRGLKAEFEAQSREIAAEDEPRREHLERQMRRLESLERFALPLIESLDTLPENGRWGEWLDRLDRLAVRSLRQPAHVLAVLAELRPMADIGPVSLDEVQRVLTPRLSLLRDDSAQRRYGKVFVGTIAEAAARSFETVFLPGLAEGIFPRKSLEDPLLLDELREASGLALARQPDRFREERFLLHTALGAAHSRLVVSYPRMSINEGRSRVPSFYALELLRAAEGRIPDLDELEKRATEASMSRLGWPSPLEVRFAIDDAEHDLAVIGSLMQQTADGSTSSGRGRYLVDANLHLGRSLRTRGRRWRNFWSAADGLVDPDPETRSLLSEERTRARSYSATALQQFAACPYRFLLHAVHRLRPRDEAVRIEQLDPLTRGAIYHSVLFRTLTRLRTSNLLPVSLANRVEARAIADGVLDETAEEYRERLAPAIERIWTTEVEDLRTDLRGWLLQQAEASERSPGWVPRYFELAFGRVPTEERDPASRDEEAVIFGNVRLRGSIDMIEEHAKQGLLRVVDYKTGRAPQSPLGPTGAGEVLQPILYAAAAEFILDQPVAQSGLSFCTQRGDFRRMEVDVDDAAREAAESAVRLIDQSIADGFFPAAPRKDACAFCDYRIVCGPYEELRTSRKRDTEKTRNWTDRLKALRQLP